MLKECQQLVMTSEHGRGVNVSYFRVTSMDIHPVFSGVAYLQRLYFDYRVTEISDGAFVIVIKAYKTSGEV